MTRKQSKDDVIETARLTQWDIAVLAGDKLVELHRLDKHAVIIMWREAAAECRLITNGAVEWSRDSLITHDHFNRLGRKVKEYLEGKGYIVVVVSTSIRKYLKHGQPPDQQGKRTPTWYRSCVAGPSNRGQGMTIFPPNSSPNHPLINEKAARSMQAGSKHLANSKMYVDNALKSGNLTSTAHDHIAGIGQKIVEMAFPAKVNGLASQGGDP